MFALAGPSDERPAGCSARLVQLGPESAPSSPTRSALFDPVRAGSEPTQLDSTRSDSIRFDSNRLDPLLESRKMDRRTRTTN